jgi:hypothetical protein
MVAAGWAIDVGHKGQHTHIHTSKFAHVESNLHDVKMVRLYFSSQQIYVQILDSFFSTGTN